MLAVAEDDAVIEHKAHDTPIGAAIGEIRDAFGWWHHHPIGSGQGRRIGHDASLSSVLGGIAGVHPRARITQIQALARTAQLGEAIIAALGGGELSGGYGDERQGHGGGKLMGISATHVGRTAQERHVVSRTHLLDSESNVGNL